MLYQGRMNEKKKLAYSFLVMLGIVSLFSDLSYEGARSIIGPYLLLLGAPAATVGFVSGLGEFIGYALRLLTGYISDRTKRYWLLTIIGYAINLVAIPALALAPGLGWVYACGLLLAERFGKAIRNPAKTTIASFAAQEVGPGKGFALQETLDQIGAFLGPVMLSIVLTIKGKDEKLSGYVLGFLILAIPAAMALGLLLNARRLFPRPQEFENSAPAAAKGDLRPAYWFYLAGIACLAAGFADFPLMAYHFAGKGIFPDNQVPILYAMAMAVDAGAALVFGAMYDRRGMGAIMIASAISAFFAPFAFLAKAPWLAAIGVMLWGVGMGAQESILKAAVTTMVPKEKRGTAFGIFNAGFGAFWFLGSWLMGALYDKAIIALVAFSVFAQLLALPFFLRSKKLLAVAVSSSASGPEAK